MTPRGYPAWRIVHRCSSAVLGILALLHVGLTWPIYRAWTPDAVWFAGTGLGLLMLAGLNLAYIGVEPCRLPTTRALRAANYVMAIFGIGAVLAVPEVQAGIVLAALAGQAVAASHTLPGPA